MLRYAHIRLVRLREFIHQTFRHVIRNLQDVILPTDHNEHRARSVKKLVIINVPLKNNQYRNDPRNFSNTYHVPNRFLRPKEHGLMVQDLRNRPPSEIRAHLQISPVNRGIAMSLPEDVDLKMSFRNGGNVFTVFITCPETAGNSTEMMTKIISEAQATGRAILFAQIIGINQ